MSDTWTGPGSWMAADGKWYPPRDLPIHDQASSDDGEHDNERDSDDGDAEGDLDLLDRWANRKWAADSKPIRRSRIVAGNRIVAAAEGDDKRSVIDLRHDHFSSTAKRAEKSVGMSEETEQEAADGEALDLTTEPEYAPSGRARDERQVEGDASARPSGPLPPPPVPQPTQKLVDISVPAPPSEPLAEPQDDAAVAESDDVEGAVDDDGQEGERDEAAPDTGTSLETEPPTEPPAEGRLGSQDFTPRPPEPARSRAAAALLLVATALAVLSGVLGALWLRERSTSDDLRAELESVDVVEGPTTAELEALADQVRVLELQNQQLAQQVQDLGAFVPDVPTGRVSEIDLPIDPAFVDEVRGRFIAVDAAGSYVVWGGGLTNEITDTGTVSSTPTGVVAQRDIAWIVTEGGQLEIVSLIGEADGEPIDTGVIEHLLRDQRAMWGWAPGANELQRYRQTNARVTASASIPSPARDLTVGAGAVWVLGEDGVVYRVNTADFTVTPVSAGQEVVSIAGGTDALWALSAADGSLRRIDAVSGEVLVTVPVGRDPIDVVVSGSSVWVALRSGTSLIEVDTRTSAVVSRTTLPGVPESLSRGETGVLVLFEDDTPLVRVASAPTEDGEETADE